jgi:hypothetical protein
MNLDNMLAELRDERDRVSEVIQAFERLSQQAGKRRGRPPAWMITAQFAEAAEAPVAKKAKRGRPRKST